MSKTREQIEAEKATKPRPDLIPARAIYGGGRVMGYGFKKHGVCTWRVAETEQADPQTHLASLERHINEFKLDPSAREEGSGMPVLWHAFAQLAILIDLVENPARIPNENDGEWGITSRLRTQVTVALRGHSATETGISSDGTSAVSPSACDNAPHPCATVFNDSGWTEPSPRVIQDDDAETPKERG